MLCSQMIKANFLKLLKVHKMKAQSGGFCFFCHFIPGTTLWNLVEFIIHGGSNMTGTDLCVNKPHCAAAVRP